MHDTTIVDDIARRASSDFQKRHLIAALEKTWDRASHHPMVHSDGLRPILETRQ